MFSTEDDGDFNGGFGSSRLSNLFGTAPDAQLAPNDSLSYTAPKQPRKQTLLQAESTERKPAATAASAGASAVVVACAVHCYRLVNGQYASQGQIGAALLSNGERTEYRILLYVSQQKPVANATIHANFAFAVQPNRYATIYDDNRQPFSLLFDDDAKLTNFAKEVAIAKANVLAAASGGQVGSLVSQDLRIGDGDDLQNGDAAELRYTGSFFTGGTIGKEFDSNVRADKLLRVRVGKGSVIKGWEQGILGMKRSGKRLLVIPPHLAYGDAGVPNRIPPKSTLVFEVELVKAKSSSSAAAAKVDAPTVGALGEQQPSSSLAPAAATSAAVHQTASVPQPPLTSDAAAAEAPGGDSEQVKTRRQSITEQLAPVQQALGQKHSDKASLLTRMAKLGTAMLPLANVPAHAAGAAQRLGHDEAVAAEGQDHQHIAALSRQDGSATSLMSAESLQPGLAVGGTGLAEQTMPPRGPTPAEALGSFTPSVAQYHAAAAAALGVPASQQLQLQMHSLQGSTPPPATATQQGLLASAAANIAHIHQLQLLQQQMGLIGASADGSYPGAHGLLYDGAAAAAAALAARQQPLVAAAMLHAGSALAPSYVPGVGAVAPPYGALPGGGGLLQSASWSDFSAAGRATGPLTPGSRFSEAARGGSGGITSAEAAALGGGASATVLRMSEKIDILLSKVDGLQDALGPAQSVMETAAVVHNIRRIADENDKLKKDMVEKTAKIEAQNLKISELLQQNQRAVEQSNEMLEQRNDTYKATATQSQARVLHLEQEKIRMGEEMSGLMSQLSQLQLQVASLKKREGDLAKDMASISGAYKVAQEELLTASQHLSEKEAQLLEAGQKLKEEKRGRRDVESKLTEVGDELSDLRSSHDSLQKALNERKRKAAEERQSRETELDELRLRHQEELTSLKAMVQKQTASSEQEVMQMEQLNASWRRKLEDSLAAEKRKHQDESSTLREEIEQLKAEIASLGEVSQHLKQKASELDRLRGENAASAAANDDLVMQIQVKTNEIHALTSEKLALTARLTEKEYQYKALSERLADQRLLEEQLSAAASWKEKYERLRQQASDMKSLYEGEISKLRSTISTLEAAAQELSKSANESASMQQSSVDKVKSVMNTVFQSFKKEIDPAKQYGGSDVLQVALAIIKRETLRLVETAGESDTSSGKEEEDEGEDTDEGEEGSEDEDEDSNVEDDIENDKDEASTTETKTAEPSKDFSAGDTSDILPESVSDQQKAVSSNTVPAKLEDSKVHNHEELPTPAEQGLLSSSDNATAQQPIKQLQAPPQSSIDVDEDKIQPPADDNQESDVDSGADIAFK